MAQAAGIRAISVSFLNDNANHQIRIVAIVVAILLSVCGFAIFGSIAGYEYRADLLQYLLDNRIFTKSEPTEEVEKIYPKLKNPKFARFCYHILIYVLIVSSFSFIFFLGLIVSGPKAFDKPTFIASSYRVVVDEAVKSGNTATLIVAFENASNDKIVEISMDGCAYLLDEKGIRWNQIETDTARIWMRGAHGHRSKLKLHPDSRRRTRVSFKSSEESGGKLFMLIARERFPKVGYVYVAGIPVGNR